MCHDIINISISEQSTHGTVTWELHHIFPCPCLFSVPVALMLNHPLQQFYIRYVIVSVLLDQNIYNINEKSRPHGISTISFPDRKGHVLCHPRVDTG